MKSNALANIKCLCGDVLAAGHKGGGKFLLHRAEARKAEAIQQIDCPYRQDVMDLLKKSDEIQLSRLDFSIKAYRFLRQ
jgi:hypothetical protein